MKTINIDWNDIKSINKAETQKARLENKGYALVRTINGLNKSQLRYEL